MQNGVEWLPTRTALRHASRVAIREGSTRHAYDEIRQAIVEGRYPPGQRLIEQRVAEEFSLSRTPVREAIKMLAAEGLVSTEMNRGAVVRRLRVEDIEDLYELRARLEGYGAFRAASRITPEQLAELDGAIARFVRAIPGAARSRLDATREVNAANKTFHRTVLEAAAHERLTTMVGRTVDVPLVFQAFRRFDRASLERSNLFHGLIRHALAQGDGARAEALMMEHIAEGRDALLEAIRDHGPLEGI